MISTQYTAGRTLIRLSKELEPHIKALASQELRSVPNMVAILLREALEQRQQGEKNHEN